MSNLSWVQYHILIELARHSTRRYSQLRPQGVEGNLFAYHLKGLMNEKFIEKTSEGHYQLTVKGLQLVGTLSLNTGKIRQQPQILNALICRNDRDEYLLARWHRQPNTGKISFPHGMMHYGEGLQVAAERELSEKAGLQATLTYRGHVYVRGMLEGVLDRHMLVHMFEATDTQPLGNVVRSENSESFWSSLEAIQPDEFLPGFYEIAQLVKHTNDDMLSADIIVKIPN